MALTALEIKHAKKGRHADGNGLYLQVTEAGTKSWVFRFQLHGTRREMGLGSLADKTAVEARREAATLRAQVSANIDPVDARRQASAEAKVKAAEAKVRAITFEDAALSFIKAKRAEWSNAKHAWQWGSSLELYVFPVFGSVSVAEVSAENVLEALVPIWASKTETATRIRQRIERIMDYARFKKWRSGDNPARWTGHLEYSLPKPSSVANAGHQPALPFKQIAAFLEDLRARQGGGARGLEFAILTAARSGEVRGAKWSEINFEDRVWTVPAERMKSKREHRVPLSKAALNLLKSMPRLSNEDFIFPGRTSSAPVSDATLCAVVDRINETRTAKGLPVWVDSQSGEAVVPHGFRSTFRDWAAEVTHYPNEMAEMALAHTVNDKVEAAYRRGDMFEKRRQMMEDWAAWCGASNVEALVPVLGNAA